MPLGGEKGIRTPETLLMFTRFPGGPVQPLLHLSENAPKSTQYFPILQMTAVFSPFGIRVSAPFRSGGVLPSAPFAARLPFPEGTGSLPIPGKRKRDDPRTFRFPGGERQHRWTGSHQLSTDYVLYRLERIAGASGIILFLEANLFRAGLPVAGDSVPLSSLVLFTCRKE